MVILFDSIAKVIGIGHVHLRLHVTLVGGFHVPLEGLYRILLYALTVIVALADVEATIDISQLRSLHIPLERQFKADLHASATLIADPKVIHRLGVALVSLLTIAISLVSFLGHSFLLNDLHDTGQSQISTDTISLHLPALSPPQNHGCSGAS